jgi:hypothetical protein
MLWKFVTVGSSTEQEILCNLKLFSRVVFGYEFWKKMPIKLQLQLLNHVSSLLDISKYGKINAMRLKIVNIVGIILDIVDQAPPLDIVESLVELLRQYFKHGVDTNEMQQITDYLVYTIELDASRIGHSSATMLSSIGVATMTGSLKRIDQKGSNFSLKPSRFATVKKGTYYSLLAARNLILKLILDLITSEKPEHYLDSFVKHATQKWFYQFVSNRVHPISMMLIVQLLNVLIVTNQAKSDKIYSILKHGLSGYCNQYDVYYILFSIMLGKLARYDKPQVTFDDLIHSGEKDPLIPHVHVLPVILSLIKHNNKRQDKSYFENTSCFEFFYHWYAKNKTISKKRLFSFLKYEDDSTMKEDEFEGSEPNLEAPLSPETILFNKEQQSRSALLLATSGSCWVGRSR